MNSKRILVTIIRISKSIYYLIVYNSYTFHYNNHSLSLILQRYKSEKILFC